MDQKTFFYIISCYLFLTLTGCDRSSTDVVAEKESEEVTFPLIAPEGIPSPFNIFTVIDSDVERKDFNKIAKWYEEAPGRQVFKLFTGDEFNGDRKHARTEAGQGLKWKEGNQWHTFEATMRLSSKLGITYTIAQLFAGCCGPQARIEVRTSGRIHLGSRSNGNFLISTDEDWADGNKSFKIKIESNGRDFKIYFNDELKFTGITEESTLGNVDALYHFRWGVYSNEKMKRNLNNTVTNITRN